MYIKEFFLARKETEVAVETRWTAKVESDFGCLCCFKLEMRLMLESRGSTSHHCCLSQVAAFVV